MPIAAAGAVSTPSLLPESVKPRAFYGSIKISKQVRNHVTQTFVTQYSITCKSLDWVAFAFLGDEATAVAACPRGRSIEPPAAAVAIAEEEKDEAEEQEVECGGRVGERKLGGAEESPPWGENILFKHEIKSALADSRIFLDFTGVDSTGTVEVSTSAKLVKTEELSA